MRHAYGNANGKPDSHTYSGWLAHADVSAR
jgi:hypothetical protein